MVETSPDGRFRFVKESSGTPNDGIAYDTANGLLVGWNVLDLRRMSPQEGEAARQSVDLLKGLSHSHVLGVHSSWDAPSAGTEHQRRRLPWKVGSRGGGGDGGSANGADSRSKRGEKLVYTTAPCTTLEAFLEHKVEFLRWRVVKRWCGHVLDALAFLHKQPSPVLHKTLNLSTVYIEPSQSHLFVGGVEDIVAPASPPVRPSLARESSGGSWSERAWSLMAGGGKAPTTAAAGDAAASAPASAKGDAAGGRGDSVERGGEEERQRAGSRDIRAFGTLLIEIILKKRLEPSVASSEQWVEMLLAVSGWPASVIDFVGQCIAPVDQRPSAEELREHPFLELGTALDDEPIDSSVDLEATVSAFVAATENLSSTSSATLPAVAAAAYNNNQHHRQHSKSWSPPPPIFVAPPRLSSHRPGSASSASSTSSTVSGATSSRSNGTAPGRGGGGSSVNPPHALGADVQALVASAAAGASKPRQHPPSCPASRGPGGWANCSCSPVYTPSSASTESPSPSSPSTAPSFGGGRIIPSPAPGAAAAAAAAGESNRGWSSAATAAREGQDSGCTATSSASGDEGVCSGSGAEYFLPPGVTPAAFANATAIAAQINAANRLAAAGGRRGFGRAGRLGDGGSYDETGNRIRALSLNIPGSGAMSRASAASTIGRDGGSGPVGGGGDAGGEGNSGLSTRQRSASEDAVWDMLPSDERECRRPFTFSSVDRWHGHN